MSRIDEAELVRLGRVLMSALQAIRFLWNPDPRALTARLPTKDMNALGWLEPARFAGAAREAVVRDILDPLATIGIAISGEERAALLE